ncbi:MAG: membrane protein insertion efficiency factor YidD [Vampirovibrio sp.]|nr:membrane protein insertion efficiency factor YidD [Vampirovibrio sp.]
MYTQAYTSPVQTALYNASFGPTTGPSTLTLPEPSTYTGYNFSNPTTETFTPVRIKPTVEFNPNKIKWDPEVESFNVAGKPLNWSQKACTWTIRNIYHNMTRNLFEKFNMTAIQNHGICPIGGPNHLSCSEYTIVAIHNLGTVRGCWEGFKRILHCSPQAMKERFLGIAPKDPMFTINKSTGSIQVIQD